MALKLIDSRFYSIACAKNRQPLFRATLWRSPKPSS